MTRRDGVLKTVLLLALAGGFMLPGQASADVAGDSANRRSEDQSKQTETPQTDTGHIDPEQADSTRDIERVLVAEHASKVLDRLAASSRGRDAALALMLRPLAKHMTLDSFDLASASYDQVDDRWHALFDDLDDVPLSLLHALSAPARRYADDAQWNRYEAALLYRDAGNLAAWLHRIPNLRDDPPALDAWLRRAAQRVDSYDSLSFEPVALMVDALAGQSMQPELAELLRFYLAQNLVMIWDLPGERETAAAARAGERELWAIPVMGVHAATAIPSLGDFAKACSVEETELRRARREACLGLIRRALPGAGNLLDQGLLTGIWVRLVAGTSGEAEAIAERRTAHWQRYHGMSAMTTELDMQAWLDYHATPGASELGWVRRNMRANNIPLQPPEDWDPGTADPFHRP